MLSRVARSRQFTGWRAGDCSIWPSGFTMNLRTHAVVLMEEAGWHTTGKLEVPRNITIIALPAKCFELNRVKNIWHLWTPLRMQAVNWGTSARSRMLPSVRPRCAAPLLRASMGVRGPDPFQFIALEVLCQTLVLPAPSCRLLCHTLLRPPTSPTPLASTSAYGAIPAGAL